MHLARLSDGLVFAALSLLASLLITAPVLGQNTDSDSSDEGLTVQEEIVVSANLVEVAKDRVGSSVTVIDRDEIERRNKTTVLELLRTVPGLEVVQTGGPGKITSVFIRGGNSSHTLVTLDGVRLNGNTTGGYDFSDLTADNLERIEVVRGPQGLIHGSEAVAGAINIITRRGQGPAKGWLRGAAGTDSYSRFAAGVSGGNEKLDYSFTASRISTDGVSAADEDNGNIEPDPWRNLTVSGRLGAAVLDDGRVDLALRYTEGDTDVDGFTFGIGPTDDLNGEQERRLFNGALTWTQPITERWTQTVRLANTQDDLEGIDPDDFFSNFEILGETSEFETQADFSLGNDPVGSQDTFSIGYRIERREAESVGSYEESLYIRSLFAEALFSLGENVDLSLGARHDDHSVFGDETTYRSALSARLGEIARLHASYGTGFKAPTFNDLYFPGFGNTNLAPETSEAFDLGIELFSKDGRLSFDLTYFDSDFEELILFTFPAGFVNVTDAASEGFELSVDWRPSDRIQLQASHTYNETEDLATGNPLARRPKNRTTLGLSFDVSDKLRGNATVIAASDRIDSDGSEIDDYERLDLSLDYQLTDRLQPFVRAENLLDSDYSEIPGYTTPGLTLVGGVHIDF